LHKLERWNHDNGKTITGHGHVSGFLQLIRVVWLKKHLQKAKLIWHLEGRNMMEMKIGCHLTMAKRVLSFII